MIAFHSLFLFVILYHIESLYLNLTMYIPFPLQFNISKLLSIKKKTQKSCKSCKFNQCSRSTKKSWNLVLNTYRNTNVIKTNKIKDVKSKYLTKLDLGFNRLTSLPDAIGNLQNLTMLDLGENRVTSLPASIGNLQNLTELDLYNNQLTSIPTSLGNLQNLTELDLGFNQLTSLQKNKIKELFQNNKTTIRIIL